MSKHTRAIPAPSNDWAWNSTHENLEDEESFPSPISDRDAGYAAKLRELDRAGELAPAVKAALMVKSKSGLRLSADAGGAINTQENDISDMQLGQSVDIAALVDKLWDVLAEKFDLTEGQARGIAHWHAQAVEEEAQDQQKVRFARLIAPLVAARNIRLEAVAIAFAANMAPSLGFSTQTAAALTIPGSDGEPITKACLNKRVNWWSGFLNLPPAPGMRKASAVKSYSEARKVTHWRKSREITKDSVLARMAKFN